MVRIVLIGLMVVLTGCGATPSKPVELPKFIETKVVVPVECPAPPVINRPEFDSLVVLSSTVEGTPPGVVVRAYRIALQDSKSYAKQLEVIIEGYKQACSKQIEQE